MSDVVIGDILPRTQATATATQTVFGTNWTANVASDVVVYYTPVGTPPDDFTQILSYPSQYSVSFIGALRQVQVTLVTPVANNGDIITITRMTPADRLNLYSNTNFIPSMLNNDFGILTLVDQQAQLVNQLVGPRYNYSAVILDVVDTILPLLPPNYVWTKNSSNTAIIAVPLPGGSVPGGGTINSGLINQIAWYAANGTTISGLPTGNNGVLVTDNTGVPSISSTLPTDMAMTTPKITTGIKDVNGNLILGLVPTASAVNYISVTNQGAGSAPSIAASGTDTNIIMSLFGKGTGGLAIHGTGTNDIAAVGFVGEVISSILLVASAVPMTSNTDTNITLISLTAGDWDVWGEFFPGGAATTTITAVAAEITTTSATISNNPSLTGASSALGSFTDPFVVGTDYLPTIPLAPAVLTLAVTTTVYLVGRIVFGTSTGKGFGKLVARRRR